MLFNSSARKRQKAVKFEVHSEGEKLEIDDKSSAKSSTKKRDEKYEVKLSETEVFTNGIKSVIGIGFLVLPSAIKDAGIIAAVVSAFYVLFLATNANSLLLKAMRKAGKTHRSYGDVTEFFLGDNYKLFVEFMVVCS